jgi:asparagine synthase (glutamine-hydrolysing)
MTMAHSLEARPPLLDHKLVEFAATVPARFRLKDGSTKYLFKQAMRGILPDQIIDRPKHGFAVPLARWFRGDLSSFARDLLLSPTCRDRGIFNMGYVERLFNLNARGRDLDLQLWTMMSFELWCRRFLDGSGLMAAAPAPIREARRQSPAIMAAAVSTGANG